MNASEETIPVADKPGIYIIRCRVNGATYAGSSLHLRKRLQSHISQLRANCCLVELLQYDWNFHGEDQFEFLACHKPIDELNNLEESLTLVSDSLDDFGGYNKMLGKRTWSLSSRIKNSEQKLIKRRKFLLLPGYSSNIRLAGSYVRTYCQRSTPFYKSELLLICEMDIATKRLKLQEQLAEFVRFDLTRA